MTPEYKGYSIVVTAVEFQDSISTDWMFAIYKSHKLVIMEPRRWATDDEHTPRPGAIDVNSSGAAGGGNPVVGR